MVPTPMYSNFKWLSALSGVGLLVMLVAVVLRLAPAWGDPAPAATPFLALSRVPVVELPHEAAGLVAAAPVLERTATATATLQAAATMARPGVIPYVVSAICRRTPEVTGTVVSTVVQLHPDNVLYFCRAAVCAAPDQVEQIVASACAAKPEAYAEVALVAFERVPTADHLILYGLTNALPALKPYVDAATPPGATNDFPALINRTVQLANAAAKR